MHGPIVLNDPNALSAGIAGTYPLLKVDQVVDANLGPGLSDDLPRVGIQGPYQPGERVTLVGALGSGLDPRLFLGAGETELAKVGTLVLIEEHLAATCGPHLLLNLGDPGPLRLIGGVRTMHMVSSPQEVGYPGAPASAMAQRGSGG